MATDTRSVFGEVDSDIAIRWRHERPEGRLRNPADDDGAQARWASGIQQWPANGDLSPVGTSEDNQYGAHAGLFYQCSGYQRDIASISRTSNQVALVVTNHIDVNYKVGEKITVSGIAAPHDAFNGDFTLSGIEEVYNPIFGTSRKIKLLYTQNNPVDDSVTAPSGMSLGLVKTTIVPKPAFWAYRNLASNKGFIVDLGQYGTNDVLTPASGKYPLSGVAVGVRERAHVGSIEVLTSMTCTDERSRPERVAARFIGAAVTPVVVTLNPESPSLATEMDARQRTQRSPSRFGIRTRDLADRVPFGSPSRAMEASRTARAHVAEAMGVQHSREATGSGGSVD